MTNDNSSITVTKGVATTYSGPDATNLFRCKMLKSMIGLHRKTGMIPTRGVTITKMFTMAQEYTGQKYKRGEHLRAEEDLGVWISTMLSALPIIHTGE